MLQTADAAKAYAARGWHPIQLHGVNDELLCTCSDRLKPGHEGTAGKHPVSTAWQSSPRMAAEQIDATWSGWRAGHNVGVATGAPSGFFVLDVDPDNGGFSSMETLQQTYGKLPETVTQRTGSGGYHLLFAMPEDFEPTNRRGGLKGFPGLDIRGTGGQIVVPPSVSAKGPYTWMSDPSAAPGPAPDWLLDLLRPAAPTATPASPAPTAVEGDPRLAVYTGTVRSGELARLAAMRDKATSDGTGYLGEGWNDGCFQVACSLLELANSDWSAYAVDAAYADVFAQAPRDAGFTDEDVNKCFESARARVGAGARPYPQERQGPEDWLDEMEGSVDPILLSVADVAAPPVNVPMRTWDDLGNAQRMVDHYGRHLRWVAEAEQWAVFRSGRWEMVKGNVVQGLVQRLFDVVIPASEALAYDDTPNGEEGEDPSDREGFLKWLNSQRMSARITAASKEAQGQTALHASMSDFDAKPTMLNVLNGVVDLRDGTLMPASPDMMLSKQVPVMYDPSAAAPLWGRFLDRVQPDQTMRSYLQRVLGYTLTASIEEQAFFIWHGDGANGKSVVAGIMSTIMDSYGGAVPPSTLLSSSQEQHPTGIAMMQGKRWLPATETAPGKRLEEEKIKEFTGGQPVAARFMGKDFFWFVPVGKIHLVTNHLPLLSAQDSIWRRTHLIRWGVRIPIAEQDRKLEFKLQAELPGILAWLVQGSIAWSQQGLDMPPVAARDLASYRGDSDPFGDFLMERTVPAPGAKTTTTAIYQAYTSWAFEQGLHRPMTMPAFVATMVERGFARFKDTRARGFYDIAPVVKALPGPWAA